jgi:low temperature requirement protein LtrA
MTLIRRNFRRWWQVPRDLSDRLQHRQVTFLELFYDLVYVVLIAELTHTLATAIDGQALLRFAFLFVIVWWAWLNGAVYHDIHGNNDIRTRVFTFLQMLTVASMAIFAHDAFGESASGFSLSYAAFQLILTYLWWRTGVYDENHRPLSTPYTVAFLFNTLLFIGSAFVPAPIRFYLWGLAVLISVSLPLLALRRGASDPAVQAQLELSRATTASQIERFGLFTIIVLGEVIVAVVQGVAGHHHLTVEVGVIGGTGMLVAIGLWWLYFDFVSHRAPRQDTLLLWIYAHLPVTAGIAAAGAAVLNVVEHAGEALPIAVRWLLVGSIAASLLGIALLIHTLLNPERDPRIHRVGLRVTLLAALAIIALGWSGLQTIPLLIVLIVLLLAPIFFGFLSWLHSVELREVGDA